MEYFVEQGTTHREALGKVRAKYGDNARILHHKSVRTGGFLGFFAKEGVEVTGYFTPEAPKRKPVDIEEEKRKILGAVKGDKTLDLVLKEVQELREVMQNARPERAPEPAKHEVLGRIEELLLENEFSRELTQEIIAKLRSELSMEQLDDFNAVQDRVVEYVAESIRILPVAMNEKPFVFILVGPTGVGKTTTIAKLAAMYALGSPKRRPFEVRILTIDNYRIGARQQMEIYGDIMGIPVTCVESREDFEKQLAVYADVDVIFIDTIGKSPRDYAKLGEMRELLASCGRTAHTHLAMSATTKPSDMEDVMQQFEPFGYESIIATKVDETQRVGGLISLLHRKGKGVSFLTDGQRVPQDIEPATVMRFLRNLEGFRIDREQLEQRFALREGE